MIMRNCLLLSSALILLFSCGKVGTDGEENPLGKEPSLTEPCLVEMGSGGSLKALFDCDGNRLPDSSANEASVAWIQPSFFNEDHKWMNGVGRFSGCTASLIDTQTESESSPAYLITNGHCLGKTGYLPSDRAVFNDSSPSRMIFSYYYDYPSTEDRESYQVKNVPYASMYKTDVAVIELEGVTLQELKTKGVQAYPLAKSTPKKGNLVENVGVPMSGILDISLRQSLCTLGDKVSLEEGPFVFPSSYRLKCSILPGSSGSPVFKSDTREIFAVMNTTVSDGYTEDCGINRPCEVGESETKTVNTQTNYLQSTSFLADCFTEEGVFDRDLEDCVLVGAESSSLR